MNSVCRGLVPSCWHSSISEANRSQLTIEIQMSGLGRETVNYLAACMRQIVFVEVVLTSQRHVPG